MLVFSDVQSLCISARLWLQVGSPKRLRSDLNQTVSFPPTLFSSSMLRVYFKSILAHTCTASPLTSVVCSKNFCPFISLFVGALTAFFEYAYPPVVASTDWNLTILGLPNYLLLFL